MKKLLYISLTGLLTMMLLSTCNKEEIYDISNLNHNTILVLGHAGMGDLYKYPNNSWESIEPVIGIGADGTEIDVQITKDSVLILFHDETLDGRTRCEGYGSPYLYDWDDIRDCYYNTIIKDIRLNTVDEIFQKIPNIDKYYFSFDCKLSPDVYYDTHYRLQFLRAIQRICMKYKIENNVFLEGDLDLLLKARSMGMNNKGFVIGSSVEEAAEHNIFGIGVNVDASKETIENAHTNGIYVMMWGAKTDAGNKKAIRLNPDILQTDKPIPLLMLFDRFNYDYNIP
jgi:glycerophosphoryl diester phosphodiesterase